MNQFLLAALTPTDVALFGIFILVVILILVGLCIYGIWLSRKPPSLSPYSKKPLRPASDLPYFTCEKVLRYLYDMHQYDNKIFNIRKAAFCRETGRIFPFAINWHNKIDVDWTFLQKRYPGKYVSWGSLTHEQQELIRSAHEPLDAFQADFSSRHPQPKAIEAKYAFAKPGPLYVDLETKVLLGWQCVPDTEMEVLVVQKPIRYITLSVI